jgi:hypothetical protein
MPGPGRAPLVRARPSNHAASASRTGEPIGRALRLRHAASSSRIRRNERLGRTDWEGDVSLRRLTACLALGVVTGLVLPCWSAFAAGRQARSYPLPSDGWRPGQTAMQAISSSPFQARLTKSGACTSGGSLHYLWPAGYRVRFHPTELLGPNGQVVAHEGEYITVGGGVVGAASWPRASRCDKGGDLWAVQGPVRVGRPGLAS